MTHIDFQGRGSKVKVTCLTSLLYAANKTKAEVFGSRLLNLVHILLITKGGQLLILKVRGQGHILNIVVKNKIKTKPFGLGPSNLVHILAMSRGHVHVYCFQGQGSKVKATFCQLKCYFPLEFTCQVYFTMFMLLFLQSFQSGKR